MAQFPKKNINLGSETESDAQTRKSRGSKLTTLRLLRAERAEKLSKGVKFSLASCYRYAQVTCRSGPHVTPRPIAPRPHRARTARTGFVPPSTTLSVSHRSPAPRPPARPDPHTTQWNTLIVIRALYYHTNSRNTVHVLYSEPCKTSAVCKSPCRPGPHRPLAAPAWRCSFRSRDHSPA